MRSFFHRPALLAFACACAIGATVRGELQVTEEDRAHWAFAPLRHTEGAQSIDQFVKATLAGKGLKLSPLIDRRREVRRVYFDLVGLPPTPEQVERYVSGAQSYDALVDELLASPHYGERWARMWLDAARYADSDGYESDYDRANAWPYRDFVIRTWNEDMPFDQFVRWQIAGDELAPDDPQAVIATGFLTAGPHAEVQPTDLIENKEKVKYDNLDDVLATTGSAMLGLTVACARCHDHKYDPIPTRDYYRMLGAFVSGERGEFATARPRRELDRWLINEQREWKERKMAELNVPEEDRVLLRYPRNPNNQTQGAAFQRWENALTISDADFRASLSEEQRVQLAALEQAAKDAPVQKALVYLDRGPEPEKAWLLTRGDAMRKREEVPLGFLQVLTHEKQPADFLPATRTNSTMQRTALAAWMTDTGQGAGALLARVIVNRLWQQHFGEGLVRTPNDFGLQGQSPTHPELLDWLAGELIRGGWRIKPIQRLILMSATYRQGIECDATVAGHDPENRLLSHRRPLRLEAEILRDSILAVSGVLNEQAGGPGFKPPIPAEALATKSKDAYPANVADDRASWRRGIYMFTKRSARFPMMEVFDAPDPTSSCGRRIRTTVPTQQLTLLNDEFIRHRAANFANRLANESDTAVKVQRAFQLALARPATDTELTRALAFLTAQTARTGSDHTALVDFCHALFTLNEFVYVD